MTQPKKPSKKYIYDGEIINAQNTILRLEALSYNHAIDEMEAYYQPIVEELVDAMEKIVEEKGHKKCYEAEKVKYVFANRYHIFREIAKQSLTKYKESK